MCSCYIFAAKAARRRGGQSRPAAMQGRPPMGSWPRRKPLARAAAGMCGRPQAWPAPAGVTLVGVGARGQATRGCYPLQDRKGQPRCQGYRVPRKAAPLAREVPPEGSSTYRRGGCPRCCLRRAVAAATTVH
ncbi:hypothetical protein B296_00038227 [Ensete ventricosum]|uniref:Uncharacterized protein n=1 Tax=Ensete ventricosum TaxID=4639 RepID=A0A426WZM0_ENSVE|nr:hypothetical protein B296_00038227 [Ensete ventricosum]